VNIYLFICEHDKNYRLGNLPEFIELEIGIFFGAGATCALILESIFKPSTDA